MKTVQQVARLCGVSVRTLHYYDQIGLLSPAATTEAGYRLYGETELSRLQQILFFRELDFPLKEIAELLDHPSFDQNEALTHHREVLILKRDRLDGLVRLVDQLLKGEQTMSFQEFDKSKIEQAQRQYAKEAAERWGDTDAFQESQKKTSNYSDQDWARINAEMEGIYRALAGSMDQNADAPEVQKLVKQWQDLISRNFYACTNEILAGLGEMYAADERFTKNIDQYGDGLAQFMSDAIRSYCARS